MGQQQHEDPEKRFHSIMDKLFHYPKSTSSSTFSSPGTGGQQQELGGKKRPNPSSRLVAQQEKQHCVVAAESPLCRPWSREDLLKRLSTFKSMTWFAKPKVISAVNCARRGWVNVDMDIIACESCGARLLFSSPPSWTLQQVEKAASVFSLKLDSGHKLLCPWIDNACDESLAEFPPTMAADLVNNFQRRSYSLFQLSALPLISSWAIEFMSSPQLEEFLRQPLMVDPQKGNAETSQLEAIEDGSDADSAKLYYQAQNLISLCGWEPRLLPFVVDCKDGSNQSVKDADILNSSQGINYDRNSSLSILDTNVNKNLEENKDLENSCSLQYDPKSVVLDCKLCGASVGLWAFSTIQRPIEFFRLVGYAEANAGVRVSSHESNVGDKVVAVASNGESSHMEQTSILNLTIAGGPPATRQNFKATISMPVIGRSLRARLAYNPEFRDQIHNNQQVIQEKSDCNRIQGGIDSFNNMRTLESRKDDKENFNSTRNDQSPSNHDPPADDDIVRDLMPLEGIDFPAEGVSFHAGACESNMGSQKECLQNAVQDSCQRNSLPEKVDNDRSAKGIKDNDSPVMVTSGKESKQLHTDKMLEFDPIRQHRHFCPWIASTGGGAPGWQQTLSALLCKKDPSRSLPTCSSSSASMITVDDPIGSIRKLFMSPKAKKMKTTHL